MKNIEYFEIQDYVLINKDNDSMVFLNPSYLKKTKSKKNENFIELKNSNKIFYLTNNIKEKFTQNLKHNEFIISIFNENKEKFFEAKFNTVNKME